MAMSKRDMEDLRPTVDTVMQKTFGFSDPTVVVAALNCVAKGMDKTRTVGKLQISFLGARFAFVRLLRETQTVSVYRDSRLGYLVVLTSL